ncbi:hypothetical protein H5410_052660 [Solanum commersonii]|uniref:Uncharacterized protein n=1 Tax=Solanum commersonii TaxID=4109 RepID=A0A9J5X1F2_SOLCO|nr:hypothetical protein H5410_052660 [Solanum commersonii]
MVARGISNRCLHLLNNNRNKMTMVGNYSDDAQSSNFSFGILDNPMVSTPTPIQIELRKEPASTHTMVERTQPTQHDNQELEGHLHNGVNEPISKNVTPLQHAHKHSHGEVKVNSIPEPTPYTIIQSYVARLRHNQSKNDIPIEFTSLVNTTKHGLPIVIFEKDDYMVKMAAKCKCTLVG